MNTSNSDAMKYWTFFLLLVLKSLSSVAQTHPVIELFFEDAQGRRDTILIGVSTLACDSTLNPVLGEARISDVFPDSLAFKVIGSKVKQVSAISDNHIYKAIFSRKNFLQSPSDTGTRAEFERCGSLHQMLVLKSRVLAFPLKITWNWQPYSDTVNFSPKFMLSANQFSTKDGDVISAFLPTIISLHKKDSIVLQEQNMTLWPNAAQDYLMFFSIQHVIVGTKDLKNQATPTIQIYPNPANSHIQLNTTTDLAGSQLQFFNVLGTLLKTQNIQNTQIDISDLPTGVLIGLLSKDGLPTGVFRVVKK